MISSLQRPHHHNNNNKKSQPETRGKDVDVARKAFLALEKLLDADRGGGSEQRGHARVHDDNAQVNQRERHEDQFQDEQRGRPLLRRPRRLLTSA